ncbi:hypothetical protein [Burkholderia glumae]
MFPIIRARRPRGRRAWRLAPSHVGENGRPPGAALARAAVPGSVCSSRGGCPATPDAPEPHRRGRRSGARCDGRKRGKRERWKVSGADWAGGMGGFAATGMSCPGGRRGGVDDLGFAIGAGAEPEFMVRLSTRSRASCRWRRAMRAGRRSDDAATHAAARVGFRRGRAMARLA